MTPDQHAAKAEELARRAEQIALISDDPRNAGHEATSFTTSLDHANTLSRLAQVHALLSLRPTGRWPSHVPNHDVVDYGDGFPQ